MIDALTSRLELQYSAIEILPGNRVNYRHSVCGFGELRARPLAPNIAVMYMFLFETSGVT
jgi:hypothetical protein